LLVPIPRLDRDQTVRSTSIWVRLGRSLQSHRQLKSTLMTRPRPPEPSSCSTRRSDPAFVRSIDADYRALDFFGKRKTDFSIQNLTWGRVYCARRVPRDGTRTGGRSNARPMPPRGAFRSPLVAFSRAEGGPRSTRRDVQGARGVMTWRPQSSRPVPRRAAAPALPGVVAASAEPLMGREATLALFAGPTSGTPLRLPQLRCGVLPRLSPSDQDPVLRHAPRVRR
jgi:hypothetical protein